MVLYEIKYIEDGILSSVQFQNDFFFFCILAVSMYYRKGFVHKLLNYTVLNFTLKFIIISTLRARKLCCITRNILSTISAKLHNRLFIYIIREQEDFVHNT